VGDHGPELKMSQIGVQIGPADHGRRMKLTDFEHAEGRAGHQYELSQGVITVVDVPDRRHLAQVHAARRQFYAYEAANPGRIHSIASGGECKILISAADSERHPDLAIYKSPPDAEEDLWANWVPEIAIEVVSPGSEHRDYVEKREEYFQFGVREYWIIDAARQEMLVLRRSGGRWVERIVGAEEKYKSRLLPGFEFDLKLVLEAARATG
jgi:Uma2 family endonuclease